MNYSPNQNQLPTLEKQKKTAQYMLLATIITTVVNIALMVLGNTSFYIPYCAALPYYLTVLGFLFDGYQLGTYTATGMVMAFVALAAWLLIWWKAKNSRTWLLVGMIMVIADTVFLVVFAILFLENPAGCLGEGLLHLGVIYELHVGMKAHKRLEQIRKQQAAELFDPWNEETPTEAEYSDILEE